MIRMPPFTVAPRFAALEPKMARTMHAPSRREPRYGRSAPAFELPAGVLSPTHERLSHTGSVEELRSELPHRRGRPYRLLGEADRERPNPRAGKLAGFGLDYDPVECPSNHTEIDLPGIVVAVCYAADGVFKLPLPRVHNAPQLSSRWAAEHGAIPPLPSTDRCRRIIESARVAASSNGVTA